MSITEKPVIVVVGSLHYDIMVDAPDRPRKGETVTGHAWRPKFGGKGGNQAIAAANAGAEVRMVGAVGDDDFGRFLLEALHRGHVDIERVMTLAATGSGMSVAIADAGGDYGAVIVSGANLAYDPANLADRRLWQGSRALILQNEMPESVNVAAARAAKEVGAMVCLNAAPFRPLSDELKRLIDVVVVNAVEAEQMGTQCVSDLASAEAAAATLVRDFPAAVVTAGGDGVSSADRSGMISTQAALPVTLVSTHGAGDVFVGSLVTSLALRMPLADAADAANRAAAMHVSSRM